MVPVNWHLAEPELAYILANSHAKAVFAHARIGARRLAALALRPGMRAAVGLGEAPGFTPLEQFAAEVPRTPVQRPQGRILAYTSATTGLPKAVRFPLEGAERAGGAGESHGR